MRRTCEGLLLLLLATGFATLASTGRLGWAVVAVAAAAFVVRGYAWFFRRPLRWSSRAWSLALLAYLPVYVWDGLELSHSFLLASLHLVVLAGAARLFAPHSERDELLLGILAFLEVLTAALLTVSGVFFILFLLFLVLLVATLVSYEIARAQRAGVEGRAVALRRGALLRFSLVLSLMVAVCGGIVFLLLPRTTVGGWAARPLDKGLSGFSDEVRLGAIASLQRSDRAVMHIRLIDAQPRQAAAEFPRTYWRGRALTTFDGTRWFDADPPSLLATPSGRLDVSQGSARQVRQIVRYQVTLEPLDSPVLFFPARLLRAATRYPVLAWDRDTDTLAGLGQDFSGTSYSGVSDLAEPGPQDVRWEGGWRGAYRLRRYLQLPEDLDPRIAALARRVVTGVPEDNWHRMQALTEYLRSHYQYSLQDLPQGAHPLAQFLFDEPRGDCEYFASALAVMARTLGIPTRLVNGFLPGAYNPITGEYLVTGSDAHSWVEALFATTRQGRQEGFHRSVWVSYDATPPSAGGAGAAGALPGTGMLLDAISSNWQRWVVDYDWLRQAQLAAGLQQEAGAAWLRTQTAAEQAWTRLEAPASAPAPGRESWRQVGSWLLILCLLGLGGAVVGRSLWKRQRQHGRPDPAAQQREARDAYRSFQRRLARLGIERGAAQTAEELLVELEGQHPPAEVRASAARFLLLYGELRFGVAEAGGALQLRSELRQFRRLARRRAWARHSLSLLGASPQPPPVGRLPLDRGNDGKLNPRA